MVSPGRMVIHSLLVDESGSTATEYGLVAALCAIFAIAGVGAALSGG